MHISLVAGRKTHGYIRYSLLLFPLLFAWLAAAVDVGVQKPKIPDAFYDVEIPDGQV